jgi:stage II sporulation protein D
MVPLTDALGVLGAHDVDMQQREGGTRRGRGARGSGTTAIVAAMLVTVMLGAANADAGSFVPGPTPIIGRRGPTPITGPVTFYGRGFGHGVGMSQYGARGRADAGQSVATILAHYYQGTTIGDLSPTVPPTIPLIRVLVLDKFPATTAVPLTMHGRSANWTVSGTGKTFPKDAVLRLIPTITSVPGGVSVTWRVRIVAADGTTVLHDAASTGSFVVGPGDDATRLQLDSKPSSFDTYRGTLRVIAGSTSAAVTVVNSLPLESYLKGVVPSEMPAAWNPEALKAQAVVARGYAARRIRPGVGTFDVKDDTSSQVYLGVENEKATTNTAIASTANKVVKSGSTLADTLFHSTGGAATENNEYVFVSATGDITNSPVSYLRGSSDRAPNGTPYDSSSPWLHWNTATYTVAQLSAWLGSDPQTSVGTLTAIDLHHRGVSGRLISVTLIGTAGTKIVSGTVFRTVFNASRPPTDPLLRSNAFALTPFP